MTYFEMWQSKRIKVPYEEMKQKEIEKWNNRLEIMPDSCVMIVFDARVNAVRTGEFKRKWSDEKIAEELHFNRFIGKDLVNWYRQYYDDVAVRFY